MGYLFFFPEKNELLHYLNSGLSENLKIIVSVFAQLHPTILKWYHQTKLVCIIVSEACIQNCK